MRWFWLLLFTFAGSAASTEITLGRLFYTPDQRAALEEARRKNIRAEEQAAEASKKPKAAGPRTVTLNGVMRRSDGESAIWVNGKPVEDQANDGMRVRLTPDQAGVTVHDTEKGRTVRLKVGQHADLVTGKVEENYARRQAPVPDATGEATPTESTLPAASGDTRPSGGASRHPDRTAAKNSKDRGIDEGEDQQDAKGEERSAQ